MTFFQPVAISEALDILLQAAADWPVASQLVPLEQAGGRFLAGDIVAPEDVPAFDRSLVDGYAVYSGTVLHAAPTAPAILTLQARVDMGCSAPALAAGSAVYVPTGGMLPEGADGVVMLEYAREIGGDVWLHRQVYPGENCSFRGEDIRQGQSVMAKGERLGRSQLGVLAALSIAQVSVIRQPRVAIFSTGDELVGLGDELKPGQIRDINRYTLAQAVADIGGQVVLTRRLKDNLDDFLDGLNQARRLADISLISGGSSVGQKDFTQQAIERLSGREVLINGMLIKPGKPTLAGVADQHLIIGLPGHPVSAIRVFDALVEDYFRHHYGCRIPREHALAETSENFPSTPGQRTYQAVRLIETEAGYQAEPLFSKSAWVSQLIRSDGVVEMDEATEGLAAGTTVLVERRR